MNKLITAISLTWLLVATPAFAQRLESIGKEPLLKVNGSVSTNQIFYGASGIHSRRDPYTFFVNGGLNLDIYGWVVPFSFSYSNQTKGAFQQPFNQYSLHPSYKWVTAHIGYQSMSLSSYTVNGHTFSGLGVDLAPEGKWKVSALAGRFQKAVDPVLDEFRAPEIEPAYQRMGYGVKVSYASEDQYDLILFKAKDEINSISAVPEDVLVNPQDNVVVGFNFNKKLGQRLLLNGEIGLSALTNNLKAAQDSTSDKFLSQNFLLETNASTAYYKAFKTGLQYNLGRVVVGAGYERIDPEYKTLGAYYFANDLENITGNITTRFWQDKISLAMHAGVQRDDLRNDKVSSMKRFVGSLNMGANLNSKLSVNASYSNFQSYVNIKTAFDELNSLTPYDNLDTLNFTQISQQTSLGANYILRQDQSKTSLINLNVSHMLTTDEQGRQKQNTGGQFYNFNGSYALNLVPQQVSLNIGVNANENRAGEIRTTTWGPTGGINKSFFDKQLRSGVSLSWNQSETAGQGSATVINSRFNNTFVFRKKHNLNLSLVMLVRASETVEGVVQPNRNYREFTTTLGYNHNF
ncbi:hypothetical protein [Pontibacter kalidii]|uniref:hypothetical protein n=1 Tax=Pontibacter kalidii TaxID=2592049 RepID=UPI00224F798E|nr:hypothetical protein [Pontibacter kalidii]